MIKLSIKVININKNVLINILTKSKAPKEIAFLLIQKNKSCVHCRNKRLSDSLTNNKDR